MAGWNQGTFTGSLHVTNAGPAISVEGAVIMKCSIREEMPAIISGDGCIILFRPMSAFQGWRQAGSVKLFLWQTLNYLMQ